MSKTLILCTSILLCCVLAEALVCYTCTMNVRGKGCTRGKGTCVAKFGQQCKIVATVQRYDKKGYYQQGCTIPTDDCGTSKFSKKLGTLTTKCCKDRDFCNKE